MQEVSPPLWHFAADFDAARALRLLAVADYTDVIQRFDEAVVTGYVWERFTFGRLSGTNRAAFLLEVRESTYDAFFNSPVGYRAQYALGVETGLAGNRDLIDALDPKLMGSAWAQDAPNHSSISISLRGTDAKIWIDESEIVTQMGRDAVDIIYPRWREHSEDGAGLLAPLGTRIVVLGAWLDKDDNERRDPLKANRALDIHLRGYT